MNRASAAAALGIGLLLAARVAADPPAAGKPVVPTSDLPRIGTVGDFPAAPSVEVSVAADGGVYVQGSLCDLDDLRMILAAKASAAGRDADTGESPLSVVFRVAAASRWDVVPWLLQAAASPSVRAYRTFFSVRAEEDDSEGAIAMFGPPDGSIRAPGPVRRAVRMDVEGTPPPAAGTPSFSAIRAAVRQAGEGAVGFVRASDGASLGAVLEATDLLFRAGATVVSWEGSPKKQPTAPRDPRAAEALTSIQRYVAGAGPAAPGRRTSIVTRRATVPGDSSPAPKVARSHGRIVGTIDREAVLDVREDPDADGAAKEPRSPAGQAIESGLLWLARHQSPDGGWDSQKFATWCRLVRAQPTVDGPGRAGYDVGTTGLALLAFLGAGYTNRSDDENGFGKTVASGLRYLKNVQGADGCFGPKAGTHYVYSHLIASLAMLEAYGRTRSSVYRKSADLGVAFTASARNVDGGWRYGVRPGESDTSVTFWAGLGVHTARAVVAAEKEAGRTPGITLDDAALAGIDSWIAQMTDPKTGRVGYRVRGVSPARLTEDVDRFPSEKSESMTAVGASLGLAAGKDPRSEPLGRGLRLTEKVRPSWNPSDGSIDLYYWHPAALAMAALGDDEAKRWQSALEKALIPSQRVDGDDCAAKGSWDPIDPWGGEGGRVYMTAMACLCLEAPTRMAGMPGRGR